MGRLLYLGSLLASVACGAGGLIAVFLAGRLLLAGVV
jgi:hypothetical protein